MAAVDRLTPVEQASLTLEALVLLQLEQEEEAEGVLERHVRGCVRDITQELPTPPSQGAIRCKLLKINGVPD